MENPTHSIPILDEPISVPTHHGDFISALMFLTRLQNPGDKLKQIFERAKRLRL